MCAQWHHSDHSDKSVIWMGWKSIRNPIFVQIIQEKLYSKKLQVDAFQPKDTEVIQQEGNKSVTFNTQWFEKMVSLSVCVMKESFCFVFSVSFLAVNLAGPVMGAQI
jgi:hypothetical protein